MWCWHFSDNWMKHYLFQKFLNICMICGSGDYAGYDRFVSVSCETFGLKFVVKIFICLVTSCEVVMYDHRLSFCVGGCWEGWLSLSLRSGRKRQCNTDSLSWDPVSWCGYWWFLLHFMGDVDSEVLAFLYGVNVVEVLIPSQSLRMTSRV